QLPRVIDMDPAVAGCGRALECVFARHGKIRDGKERQQSVVRKFTKTSRSERGNLRAAATLVFALDLVNVPAVDLDRILLFVAVISPLLVLAKAWRPGEIYRGWRVAAAIVLAITGLAWIFARNAAGFIGGGAWFALLFIPAVGLRKMTELAAQQRYAAARRLAIVLQTF